MLINIEMFNSSSILGFAMRHGTPLRNGGEDPGLDPESLNLVDAAAQHIADLLHSMPLTIYTSTLQRAIQTGQRLLESDQLKRATTQTEPIVTSDLDETTILRLQPEEAKIHWTEMLDSMARKAERQRQNPILNPGFVIVTHEPALYTIPQLSPREVNADYAAVNYFSINL